MTVDASPTEAAGLQRRFDGHDDRGAGVTDQTAAAAHAAARRPDDAKTFCAAKLKSAKKALDDAEKLPKKLIKNSASRLAS